MNNNPIKIFFELTNTSIDIVNDLIRRGAVMATEEKAETRMNICAACKCFEKESSRCSLCGCFMNVKVRIDSTKCPINKW